jgi:hypothetical protein
MKLTRERLKQIIKEELQEVKYDAMIGRMGGGTDEKPNYSAVPSGPDRPSSVTQPLKPQTKPLYQQIFELPNDRNMEKTIAINTLGNFVSAVETNSVLVKFDKDKVDEKGGVSVLLQQINAPAELAEKIKSFLQSKNIEIQESKVKHKNK